MTQLRTPPSPFVLQPAQGKWWESLFLRPRLYLAWGLAIAITALGVVATPLYWIGLAFVVLILLAAVSEYFLLTRLRSQLWAARSIESRLSLSDSNPVSVRCHNDSSIALQATLLDELPVQLQERDFRYDFQLNATGQRVINYQILPLERGSYSFGVIRLFVRTRLGLVERCYRFGESSTEVAVYPSVFQMRQQALRVRQLLRRGGGSARQRQYGRSYEFDQIKEYVPGDDYRQLNWKATARANQLMLNTFIEERSQQVVAVVDTGRTMLSPFDGLSLLDYAINSTLALLNVALMRGDRVGLLGFDRKVHTHIPLASRPEHLRRILEVLYAQEPTDLEPDYGALYQYIRRTVKGRSLLMLYSNFDTLVSLERNLPVLVQLSRIHLLVVVMFVNDRIRAEVEQAPTSLEDAYLNTIAAEYEANQTRIATTLRRQGILVMRTAPQELTADAVTQYLQVKQGGRL